MSTQATKPKQTRTRKEKPETPVVAAAAEPVKKATRAKKAVAPKPEPEPELEVKTIEEVEISSEGSEAADEKKLTKKQRKYQQFKTALVELGTGLEKLTKDVELGKGVEKDALAKKLENLYKKHGNVVVKFDKLEGKKTETNVKRNNGFGKSALVTREMATLAGWEIKEPKSRIDITKALCAYVKTNQLNDPVNKSRIVPDRALATVLQYNRDNDGDLTFTSLQRILKRVFVPDVVDAETVAVGV